MNAPNTSHQAAWPEELRRITGGISRKPSKIHSRMKLEVIMHAAEPLAEETRPKFLQGLAAVLPVRGQINDDDVSAAVHRALSDIIRNSAVWKEWNQNSHPTLQ